MYLKTEINVYMDTLFVFLCQQDIKNKNRVSSKSHIICVNTSIITVYTLRVVSYITHRKE